MINKNEYFLKNNAMTLEDYQKYLSAIDNEDFYQIEVILKKYNLKMEIK